MRQTIPRLRAIEMPSFRWLLISLFYCLFFVLVLQASPAYADDENVTIVVRDTDVRDVFEMLSRTEGLNIALSDEIEAKVSISLFDVAPEEAVYAVAQAAGYAVDRRNNTFLILDFDELGQDHASGATEVRSFKIQYTDTESVREILEKHLSRYGEITALTDRRMVVVEDLPDFLDRIETILEEVDRQPKQVLLEAKVLEVTLTDSDILGVDWTRMSTINGTEFTVGVSGLISGAAPGLVFSLVNENLEGAIEALTEQGRIRALASPQLLTMENQQAEVIVGERLGFRVTTTINQVTTESVEFINSGVILRFTPTVDRLGRVLMEIHPEVSTGSISDGIPSVMTTEVTTQLLANDGERIFIGGLIRDSGSEARRGVPLFSRIPLLGLLFSRSEWTRRSTETIVIVRATVRDSDRANQVDDDQTRRLDQFQPALDEGRRKMEDDLDFPLVEPKIRDPHLSGLVSPSASNRDAGKDSMLGPEVLSKPWEAHPNQTADRFERMNVGDRHGPSL